MLESLEQLENDIATFQKNMSGANGVFHQMKSMVTAVEKQTRVFEDKVPVLQAAMEKASTDLAAENAKEMAALTQKAEAEHSKYRQDLKTARAELAENKRAIEEQRVAVLGVLGDHKEENESQINELCQRVNELCQSANELSQRVESLAAAVNEQDNAIRGMDQLYQLLKETRDSANTKLSRVTVGLGVSTMLLIILLITK